MEGEIQCLWLETDADRKPTCVRSVLVKPIDACWGRSILRNGSWFVERHLVRQVHTDDFCLYRADSKAAAGDQSEKRSISPTEQSDARRNDMKIG